jgi:hypothetical protein
MLEEHSREINVRVILFISNIPDLSIVNVKPDEHGWE